MERNFSNFYLISGSQSICQNNNIVDTQRKRSSDLVTYWQTFRASDDSCKLGNQRQNQSSQHLKKLETGKIVKNRRHKIIKIQKSDIRNLPINCNQNLKSVNEKFKDVKIKPTLQSEVNLWTQQPPTQVNPCTQEPLVQINPCTQELPTLGAQKEFLDWLDYVSTELKGNEDLDLEEMLNQPLINHIC